MRRSGYSDDLEFSELAMWRGQVASAIRGKRGQKFFRDLAGAMDNMREKELYVGRLVVDGGYCTLGVIGAARGIDLATVDADNDEYMEPEGIANALNIASQLAQETMYINDEHGGNYKMINGKSTYRQETPTERWTRVRKWVEKQITKPTEA